MGGWHTNIISEQQMAGSDELKPASFSYSDDADISMKLIPVKPMPKTTLL